MLEEARRFYDANLAEWLVRYPGRFVVVKGSSLVGTFDTMEEGFAEGARRFGLDSYLVRRVQEEPEPVSIPALTLGLLNADTTCSAYGTGANG